MEGWCCELNMKYIKFTINEDEIEEIVREIGAKDLSDVQIQSILDMVECDGIPWKDINSSIVGATREELFGY